MSVSKIHRAIFDVLDATKNTVCSGIRTAATPTPCYVYEITSMELSVQMVGVAALNHWTVTAEVSAVADTVSQVTTLVDDLLDQFDYGPINSAANTCSLALQSFSIAFSTATPDDGQQDAERIATMTVSLLVQED